MNECTLFAPSQVFAGQFNITNLILMSYIFNLDIVMCKFKQPDKTGNQLLKYIL